MKANTKNKLDAVILSAGYGKRMKRLTKDIPKPLVALAGIPLIYYTLVLLQEMGLKNIAINLFYKKEKLRTELKKIENKSLFQFSFFEEEQLLGTAAGLANILHKYKSDTEDFWLVNCDILIAFDKTEIINLKKTASNSSIGFLVVEESRAGQTGLKAESSLNYSKLIFQENADLQYSGLSYWKELLTYIPKNISPYELRPVWENMAELNLLNGYRSSLEFYPVGNFEEWDKLNETLRKEFYSNYLDNKSKIENNKLADLYLKAKKFYEFINS